LKYDLDDPPGPKSTTKAPVDLWFGRRNGQYDTTHLRIAKEYLGIRGHYHGEGVYINTVWPNLLSRYEYGRMREKQGLPFEREKDFTLILTEAKPSGSGDNVATEPFHSCKPIIRDEMRSVLYCSKLRKTETSTEGWTHYLPIDESLRTPWYNNPPNAHCKVIMEQGIKRFDACYINFSYNADVDVDMMFIPEQLAIDIITDFKRLTDFLSTLEVKP
jgi:hypothetical protein